MGKIGGCLVFFDGFYAKPSGDIVEVRTRNPHRRRSSSTVRYSDEAWCAFIIWNTTDLYEQIEKEGWEYLGEL